MFRLSAMSANYKSSCGDDKKHFKKKIISCQINSGFFSGEAKNMSLENAGESLNGTFGWSVDVWPKNNFPR